MTKTKDNHFVPQWHQKGFIDEHNSKLCFLTQKEINLPNGGTKKLTSIKWHTPAQKFYKEHLYSTFFGAEFNDEIEKKLFGPIDDNGSLAVKAFLSDDLNQWNLNFQNFFIYLDAQKLRTPKGLDWIKSNYPELNQMQLMREMQSLRTIHCALWAEGVRELVSAEDSDVKFIVSDHPITIYNYACPPNSELSNYPNDPDISLKGSQTIFPLSKNRCLILTNLEYAKEPEIVNPIEQRTNATRIRKSMVNTIEFINCRKLNANEVSKINYIIKVNSKDSVASGKEEWLYPEKNVMCDWADLRHTLIPPSGELHRYGGEMFVGFDDGTIIYQDAFGRTTPQSDFLIKDIDEENIGRNEVCGCGSGRKYKKCCYKVPVDLRTTWNVFSIRERNLAFCQCIRHELGLNQGKTWLDVRKELSNEQIKRVYEFYSCLWPRETDVYALLPKPDDKFRGLYTGILDVRTIGINALPIASMFDEFLIETPIINPNNVNPEFSSIKFPNKYKYQALKDFLFMLQVEPFIRAGLINLIPDPCNFDLPLRRAMLEVANSRAQKRGVLDEQDKPLMFRLSVEDVLNSTSLVPTKARIRLLMSQFGLDQATATTTINELEALAEASPLVMLQQFETKSCGQFIQFHMSPNYEMSLFLAQVTGSVIITDSSSRWHELAGAQHREQGNVVYPWHEVFKRFEAIPIDDKLVETYKKANGNFTTLGNLLKSADNLVLQNNVDTKQHIHLASQLSSVAEQLSESNMHTFRVLSPQHGFYDTNVQTLLMKSSCLNYECKVRTVYGIGF
ncbi:DUF4238 domain-containing protein [Pseudoalteromonas ostreae]|uniref:DUF4238 domain-containing protein n=1 Tax=Pseudoalteromonas ostreae TaxID=2774154 RepID=UPI001B371E2F|nr:DUF4238 domain-containing protein [Pseudoalteromonas ostreae]